MTTLVTYLSTTGNTQTIADSIFEAVPGEKEIKPLDEVKSVDGYDLVFVGFPVQSGGAPKKVKEFLEGRAAGKRVALFVTHAMSPEAPPLQGVLKNCQAAAEGANLAGFFDCQGVLDKDLADKLLSSPDPFMKKFGEERYLTVGHPDSSDRARARVFAKSVALGK